MAQIRQFRQIHVRPETRAALQAIREVTHEYAVEVMREALEMWLAQRPRAERMRIEAAARKLAA